VKMSIAVVFSALSLGEKKLAKYAHVATTTWLGRSVLVKLAHILERIGLAMVGGAGGLYVAVGLMRTESELFRNEWMVLLMMLYGAFGFYVGIDLPSRFAQTAKFTRPGEWSFGTDAAPMASAAGTFLAAIAVFLSVGIIVLDHTMRDGFSVLVGCCWAIGTSFQIAAGAIGRKVIVEDRSE
jgi:phage-related protein